MLFSPLDLHFLQGLSSFMIAEVGIRVSDAHKVVAVFLGVCVLCVRLYVYTQKRLFSGILIVNVLKKRETKLLRYNVDQINSFPLLMVIEITYFLYLYITNYLPWRNMPFLPHTAYNCRFYTRGQEKMISR